MSAEEVECLEVADPSEYVNSVGIEFSEDDGCSEDVAPQRRLSK